MALQSDTSAHDVTNLRVHQLHLFLTAALRTHTHTHTHTAVEQQPLHSCAAAWFLRTPLSPPHAHPQLANQPNPRCQSTRPSPPRRMHRCGGTVTIVSYDSIDAALGAAGVGDGLAVLASLAPAIYGDPSANANHTTTLNSSHIASIQRLRLRVYWEFPRSIDAINLTSAGTSVSLLCRCFVIWLPQPSTAKSTAIVDLHITLTRMCIFVRRAALLYQRTDSLLSSCCHVLFSRSPRPCPDHHCITAVAADAVGARRCGDTAWTNDSAESQPASPKQAR